MKRLIVMFFWIALVMGIGSAYAIDWYTANQATIQWNAVTSMENGDPIPEGSVVKYKIWLANAITDPSKLSATEVATVDSLTHTITLNVEGKFFPGVQALRDINGEIVSQSTVSWSDDPIYTFNGMVFGIQYYLAPANPGGIRQPRE